MPASGCHLPAKTLLAVTRNGVLHAALGHHGFYPRGDGGVITAPDGHVLAMTELGLARVSTHGMTSIRSFQGRPFLGIRAFSPDGIAVSPTGAIYLDTYNGNGFSDASAIAVLRGRHARLLWSSRH